MEGTMVALILGSAALFWILVIFPCLFLFNSTTKAPGCPHLLSYTRERLLIKYPLQKVKGVDLESKLTQNASGQLFYFASLCVFSLGIYLVFYLIRVRRIESKFAAAEREDVARYRVGDLRQQGKNMKKVQHGKCPEAAEGELDSYYEESCITPVPVRSGEEIAKPQLLPQVQAWKVQTGEAQRGDFFERKRKEGLEPAGQTMYINLPKSPPEESKAKGTEEQAVF